MSSSLCDNGGVVQLRRKKQSTPPSVNNNNMGSLLQQRRQEMQHDRGSSYNYSDDSSDQYSDVGYPSLPRPKSILSFSRGTLPWSIRLASTVPVRKRSESQLTTCSRISVAPSSSQLKVNRESVAHTSLAKQSKRKSVNGISRESVCVLTTEVAGCDINSESINMSNHSRPLSRRAPGNAEDETQKSKKSRKLSKSLTFSFGSNSDLKRRALGFLGRGEKKRGEKKEPDKMSPVTPSSPILVSRKVKTLPASIKITGLPIPNKDQKEVAVHWPKSNNGSARTYHGSYQDLTKAKSSLCSKHRPLNSSSSLGQQLYHGTDVESPLPEEYSPTLTFGATGMSSRQESSESLSRRSETSLLADSASNPSSRKQSPNMLRFDSQNNGPSTNGGRKLSDPMVFTSNATESPDSTLSQPRGTALKKRYTFCVRPSRLNPETGWVSLYNYMYGNLKSEHCGSH